MRTNVENLFQCMVVKAEKDGFDTDELLEKPNAYGDTVFTIASNTSQKIISYILTRPKIDLRYTGPNFDAPCATFYPKFTEDRFDHTIFHGHSNTCLIKYVCRNLKSKF